MPKPISLVFDPATVINTTPQTITLYAGDEVVGVFPPTDDAQLHVVSEEQALMLYAICNGRTVPVFPPTKFDYLSSGYDAERFSGKTLLVSMPVGQWMQRHLERVEMPFWAVGPDTGPKHAVRNSTGTIIGTRALICYVRTD